MRKAGGKKPEACQCSGQHPSASEGHLGFLAPHQPLKFRAPGLSWVSLESSCTGLGKLPSLHSGGALKHEYLLHS